MCWLELNLKCGFLAVEKDIIKIVCRTELSLFCFSKLRQKKKSQHENIAKSYRMLHGTKVL